MRTIKKEMMHEKTAKRKTKMPTKMEHHANQESVNVREAEVWKRVAQIDQKTIQRTAEEIIQKTVQRT